MTTQITFIDQTLREGMQFRGMVFSLEERCRILEFQEALGVDICSGGYPSAHASEQEHLTELNRLARARNFKIRVAGLGRALIRDAEVLTATGISDFHLHAAIPPTAFDSAGASEVLKQIEEGVQYLKSVRPESHILLNILDIGRVHPEWVRRCVRWIASSLPVNVCMLPDTSGIMAPNRVAEIIKIAMSANSNPDLGIGVHCHNDLGMATANTIMGALSGADHVDASALGIGERNGIGDLFLTGRILKDQGYEIGLKTIEVSRFREYYEYIDHLCRFKTGVTLLTSTTPFFGDGVRTHVAGTHGKTAYGVSDETEDIFLNVLCGAGLVEKYLKIHEIDFSRDHLRKIVTLIKDRSASLNRSLRKDEIRDIVGASEK